MTDRNRSDLDREQRGSSNPNLTDRTENRSTRESGSDSMRDSSNPGNRTGSQGVGSDAEDLDQNSVGSSREGSHRSTGNIEGDENLNRR